MVYPGMNDELTHLNIQGDARASHILAPARTDEGAVALQRRIQSTFPVSVFIYLFIYFEKPLVPCISHNLCLSSLVH